MNKESKVFDVRKNYKVTEALKYFDINGFVILRGLYEKPLLAQLYDRLEDTFSRPSAGGCFGYAKKDHYRKYIFPPLNAEKSVCSMILNDKLINLVEKYMECEPVISELHIKKDEPTPNIYFPLHLDLHSGWNQGEHNHKKLNNNTPLSKENMKHKLGVGALIYMHDVTTDSGNFMFSKGSHKKLHLKGGKISSYSINEQKEIMNKLIHLDGQRGDVVLFDDRGWHGPNQPAKKSRMVIELDFTNTKIFGRWQKTDIQLPISYTNFLSEKQLRLLGKGANTLYTTNSLEHNYKVLGYNKSPFYRIVALLVKNGFIIQYYKDLIKHYFFKLFKKSYKEYS